MSIVIRPDDGQPDSLKALLKAVHDVAGDEPVSVGDGGVVVPDAVALKYLKAKNGDADTTGRTIDNTRTPLVTRHADGTTGAVPDPSTSIGGRTPEQAFPGGYEGVRADERDGRPGDVIAAERANGDRSSSDASGGASGEEPTPPHDPPAKTTTPEATPTPAKAAKASPAKASPAKAAPAKAAPAQKTTAAAQQRASRSNTTRSNP